MIPHELWEHLIQERIALSATLELTARCNWRCQHCLVIQDPRGQPLDHQPELDTAEVLSVLDQLREMNTLYLSLTGGEMLLREDLPEILERAVAHGFAISLSTNASQVTADIARRWREYGVVDVHATILGATAVTHDGITQVLGSFDAAWAGITYLVEAGVNTHVRTPIMRANHREVTAIRERVVGLGLPHLASPFLMPRCPGDVAINELRLDDEQLSSMARQLYEWLDEELVSLDPSEQHPDDSESGHSSSCRAGITALTVQADGAVVPCQGFPRSDGNVREQPLEEIWLRGELFEQLRQVYDEESKADRPSDNGPDEPKRCPLLAIQETGDPTALSVEVARQYQSFNDARTPENPEPTGD